MPVHPDHGSNVLLEHHAAHFVDLGFGGAGQRVVVHHAAHFRVAERAAVVDHRLDDLAKGQHADQGAVLHHLLGKILVPEKVGNLTFGGPQRDTMYIAAALHGQHRLNAEEAKKLGAALVSLALGIGANSAVFSASPGGGYRPPGVMPGSIPRAYLVAGTLEPFFHENATRWADALRAGAGRPGFAALGRPGSAAVAATGRGGTGRR